MEEYKVLLQIRDALTWIRGSTNSICKMIAYEMDAKYNPEIAEKEKSKLEQELNKSKKIVASGVTQWYIDQGRFMEESIKSHIKTVKIICTITLLMQVITLILVLMLLLL